MKAPFYYISINGRDISELVENFNYEDCVEEDDMLTFTIFSKLSSKFAEDEAIKAGTLAEFKFGYRAGKTSDLRKARITDISYKYGENVKISVKAMDLGTVMKKSTSNKIWRNITTREIALEIASRYGMTVEADFDGKFWKSVPQGHLSDFEFLQQLSMKETDGNYIIQITDTVIKFIRRALNERSLTTLTFKDPNSGIISFSSDYKESSAKNEGVGVSMAGFNPMDKKAEVGKADPNSQKNAATLGERKTIYSADGNIMGSWGSEESTNLNVKQVAQKPAKEETTFEKTTRLGKTIVTAVQDPTELTNMANTSNKTGNLKILTGSLVLEGKPNIRSNRIITLSGFFKRDLGNWYVKKVTHSITSSGYTTTLDLEKNGSNSKVAGRGKATNPNTAKGNPETSLTDAAKKILSVYDQNGTKVAQTDGTNYTAPK
jgi:uncharacterized protein